MGRMAVLGKSARKLPKLCGEKLDRCRARVPTSAREKGLEMDVGASKIHLPSQLKSNCLSCFPYAVQLNRPR